MDAALNREEMLHSNPLLFSSDNGGIKRRLKCNMQLRV